MLGAQYVVRTIPLVGLCKRGGRVFCQPPEALVGSGSVELLFIEIYSFWLLLFLLHFLLRFCNLLMLAFFFLISPVLFTLLISKL